MPTMPTATYGGQITPDEGPRVIRVDEGGSVSPLDPRTDLRNHSPSGFAWGYNGSGPAQLALAVLADCLQDDGRASRLYQPFKEDVIAHLDQGAEWTMTREAVREAVAKLEAQDADADQANTR